MPVGQLGCGCTCLSELGAWLLGRLGQRAAHMLAGALLLPAVPWGYGRLHRQQSGGVGAGWASGTTRTVAQLAGCAYICGAGAPLGLHQISPGGGRGIMAP